MRQPVPFRTFTMKVRTTFHRRMFLMRRPLDAAIPEPDPRGSFDFREMTPETRPLYTAMLPERGPLIDARLRRGARCFLALDGDHIAHGYWMAAGRVRIDYMECDLVLPEGGVYTFDSYSPASYRGRGLAQAVGLHVLKVARDEGNRAAWCLPAVENAAGIRPVEAIGYRPTSTLHYVRAGPLRHRWSVPPAAPDHPVLASP